MIRSMQLRVNDKTKRFETSRKAEEDLSPAEKERVLHIAEMQEEVEDLTRTMAEKVEGGE
jgi:hypothetical protein